MTKPYMPEDNSRHELRKAQRERERARERRMAEEYGIPKMFIAHARRYGGSVYHIVTEGLRHSPAMRQRHGLLNK